MADLLVVGSVGIDTVITPSGEARGVLGGAAVYASLAAAIYTRPCLVGPLGNDFPRADEALLAAHGVDLSHAQRVEAPTFRWTGSYEGDLNEAITHVTELNALATFNPILPEELRRSRYVFLANLDPDLQIAVLEQLEAPELVAADTMNFWINSKPDAVRQVLSRVDMVLMNDAETRMWTGAENLVEASHLLMQQGPRYVFIKKGANGLAAYGPWGTFAAPAYPLLEVYDPTGAGDSFAGALMGYLAAREDLSDVTMRQGAIVGSAVASFTVEDFSVNRLAHVTKDQVLARACDFQQMTAFTLPEEEAP